jgi:HemY protein
MRRVVLFLIIGIAIIAAAWALASLPGHVTAAIGSITIETSAGFAILALVLLFGVVLLLLRVFGVVVGLPEAGAGWRGGGGGGAGGEEGK